jgi:two-component system OmpR family sensor kinase
MTGRRRTLAAAPAVLGAGAAAVAVVRAPTTNVYAETRLWIVPLVGGLLVTVVLLGFGLVGRALAQARADGASEALAVAQGDHRRFLLRLDHELKNPVTAIRIGLANLAAGAAGADVGDDTRATLDSVSTQVRRIGDLVSDLRKLAELETRPIERTPVDLAELLGEVTEVVRELPDAGGRTVALALPQAPWPLGTVPGDRDLLFLALHNLLANALKFTAPGDTIEVRARDEGDQVVVEVADTGIGIPDDEVDDVWQELARGTAARGTTGMGLGLAMVRVVVARHDGGVWVRSRVGHGTVVGLRLPAA